MKFNCCGVTYSTDDPETYWCIEKYIINQPEKTVIRGEKVYKEIVYTLFCRKNACAKAEIHRWGIKNGGLIFLEKENYRGKGVKAYLERTKEMRIKQPQCCPLKKTEYSAKIPWVYGKAIAKDEQRPRYMDESGHRDVFKDQIWQAEIFKSTIHSYSS